MLWATEVKMKALRQHADGVKVDEVPVPTPGAKDVLIKVYATAITVGELDWKETVAREKSIPGA